MADIPDTTKRDEMKAKFLAELGSKEVCGNVLVACRRSGIGRSSAYEWRKDDEGFRSEWDRVAADAREAFADEAEFGLRSAVMKGNIAAIIFVLKNLRPERWKERRELETPKDKPIEVSMPGLIDAIQRKYPDTAGLLNHGPTAKPAAASSN